jgi:hypothetical protein
MPGNDIHSVDRFKGADQDGAGGTLGAGDDVEHPMHAIGEIDVGVSSRSEHDNRSICRPALVGAIAVTGKVWSSGIAISFSFNDDAAEALAIQKANQPFTQEIGGDLLGSPGIKGVVEPFHRSEQELPRGHPSVWDNMREIPPDRTRSGFLSFMFSLVARSKPVRAAFTARPRSKIATTTG